MAIKFDELLEALDPSLDKFEEDLDSMWIIIPTERRYDDLTADDYDEFINKYGTFNSRQACWDKIDELAPDRWDAFIPMRIEGVNESLNESVTKEELQTKKYIISYLSRNYPKIASLLNNFDFKLTEDPDIAGYVDLNTKHVVLNRNLSMDNAIKSILDPLREKYFRQALKDPDFIQQMKDENKEIEKLLREKEKNESLNEEYIDVQQHIDSVINFLADHEQAWEDCCNYFKLNPDDEDALYQIDPAELEDWIWDHRGLYHDLERYLSEGLNEDFDSESHISKVSFDIQYVGDGDEDDAIDRIEEIINGFEWELENNYNDIELLGSNVENMTEVYQQQYGSLDEALNSNTVLGPYSKYYKFVGSNAGFDDYMDDVLEVVEGNYGMQFIGWAEAKPKYYDRLMDDGYDYVLVVKDPEEDNIQLVTWLDDRLYPVELEDMMYESYKRMNESVNPKIIEKRKQELIDHIQKFQEEMSGFDREDDIKYGLTNEQVQMLDDIVASLSK